MESTKSSGDPRANTREVRMSVVMICTFVTGDCFPPVLTYSCKLRFYTVIYVAEGLKTDTSNLFGLTRSL